MITSHSCIQLMTRHYKSTRLDIRKTPIDETENSPRESRYSKDNTKKDPYPWLDDNDPRRDMTDKDIHESTIDSSEAHITERQKQALYKILLKYREALSLRDEIGLYPTMEVTLEWKGKTPFYIRPFPIKEEEKTIVDREMTKAVCLGFWEKDWVVILHP